MLGDIDTYIGKKLFDRRRALGLTQTELGQKIGVAFQSIQKYECGATRISAARLWQLANVMEIDLDYFFEGLDA